MTRLQHDLMQKWDHVIKQTAHICQMTGSGELAYLCEQASSRRKIVEVGTYMGSSMKCMLLASPQAEIWGVDTFEEPGTFEKASKNLEREIAEGRCHLVKIKSEDGIGPLKHLAWLLDMVWIDDGHRYAEVQRDIRNWLPMLKPGGLLCGHDYEPNCDVGRAVRDSLKGFTEPVPRLWAYTKP